MKHPGIVGEITAFEPHMNMFKPATDIAMPSAIELRRAADSVIVNQLAKYEVVDSTLDTSIVNPEEQPAHIVAAAIEGARPAIALHQAVVAIRLPRLQTMAREVSDHVHNYQLGQARSGNWPVS